MITRTATEILREAGLPPPPSLPNGRGRYYECCPQCSAGRSTPAHRKAKVLGIRIDDVGVKWGCNHCNWTGGGYFKSNSSGRNDGYPGLYDYHHPTDGRLLFQKVRNHPGREPRFWLRRPDGNGGWINNVEGVDTTILYRLPEVNEAIANDHEIALVEGEKDADNLWKIGIPATCNAHGAADPTKNQKPKWYLAHSEQLRGARIIVFNDNDVAGYDHAEATCKLSLGIAKRVRRLDLKLHWPDMPHKADVSDWLAVAGNTREKLDALMAMAPDYRDKDDPSSRALPLTYFDDLSDNPTPKPWVIKNVFARGELSSVIGPPGTGKSALFAEIAIHAASAMDWRGYRVKQRVGVVIFAFERADLTKRRLAAYKRRDGLKGLPIAVTGQIINLLNPACTDIMLATIRDAEKRFGCEAGLIIVDTYSRVSPRAAATRTRRATRTLCTPISAAYLTTVAAFTLLALAILARTRAGASAAPMPALRTLMCRSRSAAITSRSSPSPRPTTSLRASSQRSSLSRSTLALMKTATPAKLPSSALVPFRPASGVPNARRRHPAKRWRYVHSPRLSFPGARTRRPLTSFRLASRSSLSRSGRKNSVVAMCSTATAT